MCVGRCAGQSTGIFVCVLQVFYKAVRDIQPGEEMLLYARDALYPEIELETMAMHKLADGESFCLSYFVLCPSCSVCLTLSWFDMAMHSWPVASPLVGLPSCLSYSVFPFVSLTLSVFPLVCLTLLESWKPWLRTTD